MGTGRTLNKDPRTRPIKSQGEKRRRSKVQRARLVKLGMDVVVVAKMQPVDVRKLVQHPKQIKKSLAAAAAKVVAGVVKPAAVKKTAPKPVAKAAVKTLAVKKPAVKKPAVKKPAVKKTPKAE